MSLAFRYAIARSMTRSAHAAILHQQQKSCYCILSNVHRILCGSNPCATSNQGGTAVALVQESRMYATTTTNTAILSTKLPPEEYYDGHLMADHLEYLDDMMESMVKMEAVVDELQATHEKKKQVLYSNVHWMGSKEIDDLFAESAAQEKALREKMANLKELMTGTRTKAATRTTMYGVDSPDGTSDDMRKTDMEAVEEIIEHTARRTNKDKR